MKNFKTSFLFLRLPMAISLLGHGLVRLPKLTTFAEGMVSSMEVSMLPAVLIRPFGYVLPIVEALLGLTLLMGFQIRYTLYASLALMSILVLGSSSVENWGAVQAQLVHAIYLFGLLWYYEKYTVQKEGA
ncbi:MAG TPA: DoxX family protein [Sphingobacterium sp.]|nr:DoxX family protein [Sphingobacterium sp.]